MAKKFVDCIINLNGLPKLIISDHNPIFISLFWHEFFRMLGTKLHLSYSYHPQVDFKSEASYDVLRNAFSVVHHISQGNRIIFYLG